MQPNFTGPTFDDMRAELLRRITRLVEELAPGGTVSSGYYITRNPKRDDRHAGSFWVRVSGERLGQWKDEATMQKAGDVFSFIQHCEDLVDMSATRTWVLRWLGWDKTGAPKVDPAKRLAREKADRYFREQQAREQKAELEQKRKSAKAWWLSADPKIEGTVVEAYLASRGIEFGKLHHVPGALRYLEKQDHTDVDGVVTTWPCMIAAMCDGQGQIIAVHRTFLSPDGKGKAPVKPAKKIWPHGYQGSVIRLAKGEGNYAPEQAMKRGHVLPLVLCEGIENALTCSMAKPLWRVWATATNGNRAHVPVEHPCVGKVIVFADNDTDPQVVALFDKGVEALRKKREVTVVRTPMGKFKDANDLLRGV
jgi:Toprim domain